MFSILAVNLIFLLLPGFIGRKIIDYFSHSNQEKTFNFFLVDSFIIGNFSYFILFIYKKIFSKPPLYLLTSIREDKFSLNAEEITWSILISIFFSIIYCYLKERDYIFTLSSKIKLTNRSSIPSIIPMIFGFKYNNEFTDKWVHIRVLNDNRSYVGYIQEWCIESEHLELLLKEVEVNPLNEEENPYELYSIYLKVPYKDIVIEFINESR